MENYGYYEFNDGLFTSNVYDRLEIYTFVTLFENHVEPIVGLNKRIEHKLLVLKTKIWTWNMM